MSVTARWKDSGLSERVSRVRRATLPVDARIVVRGDDLIDGSPQLQAIDFRRRFPNWGRWRHSAFYARSDSDVDDLAADRLEHFPVLRLYRPEVLEAAGFEIMSTFRMPHVTLTFDGDLDVWVDRLRTADHDERTNPSHERD